MEICVRLTVLLVCLLRVDELHCRTWSYRPFRGTHERLPILLRWLISTREDSEGIDFGMTPTEEPQNCEGIGAATESQIILEEWSNVY